MEKEWRETQANFFIWQSTEWGRVGSRVPSFAFDKRTRRDTPGGASGRERVCYLYPLLFCHLFSHSLLLVSFEENILNTVSTSLEQLALPWKCNFNYATVALSVIITASRHRSEILETRCLSSWLWDSFQQVTSVCLSQLWRASFLRSSPSTLPDPSHPSLILGPVAQPTVVFSTDTWWIK